MDVLFTFVTTFRGGTFVAQNRGKTVKEAISAWV
jgi:hypothetical protein